MQRLGMTLFACSMVLGLSACDKQADKKADDKKADVKKADVDKKTDDVKKADVKKADDDNNAAAEPEAEPVEDDTVGLATLIREAAKDSAPAAPVAAPPHYDTSKDAGGLIGHLATGLAHDEALADSTTSAELAKLAGEESESASDTTLCKHAWTIATKAYAELAAEGEAAFNEGCKHEVEKQRVKLGVEIFDQHSNCVLAAAELAALDACDAAEDEAERDLHANPHGDQPEEKTCVAAVEHAFILITRDMTGDPDLLEVLEEDIEEIKTDAVLACRDEGTQAELACVMKAGALKDLEGCK